MATCPVCNGSGRYATYNEPLQQCALCAQTGEVHGTVAAYGGGVVIHGFVSKKDRAWAEMWAEALRRD